MYTILPISISRISCAPTPFHTHTHRIQRRCPVRCLVAFQLFLCALRIKKIGKGVGVCIDTEITLNHIQRLPVNINTCITQC